MKNVQTPPEDQEIQSIRTKTLRKPSVLNRFKNGIRIAIAITLGSILSTGTGCTFSPSRDLQDNLEMKDKKVSTQRANRRKSKLYEYLTSPPSHISIEQQKYIEKELEEFINFASDHAFEEYISLIQEAKEKLGIQNPNRYTLKTLKHAVGIINKDPEIYDPKKPVIFVILAPRDYDIPILKKLGIKVEALSVESHKLEELTKAHNLCLLEAENRIEVQNHLQKFQEKNIISNQQKNGIGIIMGAHGTESGLEAGINTYDMEILNQLLPFLSDQKRTYLILASCNGGEGKEKKLNIANACYLLANANRKTHSGDNEVVVIASKGFMTGIDFEIQEDGSFTKTPHIVIKNGVFDGTYSPKSSELLSSLSKEISQELGSEFSAEQVKKCLENGIFKQEEIALACQHPKKIKEIAQILRLEPSIEEVKTSIEANIPIEVILKYLQAGLLKVSAIPKLIENGISDEIYQKYTQAIQTVINPSVILRLHQLKYDIDTIKNLLENNQETDKEELLRCIANGLPIEEYHSLKSQGLNFNEIRSTWGVNKKIWTEDIIFLQTQKINIWSLYILLVSSAFDDSHEIVKIFKRIHSIHPQLSPEEIFQRIESYKNHFPDQKKLNSK